MDKNILLLAIVSFLAVQLKQIIFDVLYLLYFRISFSITVSTNDSTTYYKITEWLNNLNVETLNDNISYRYVYNEEDKLLLKKVISYGKYFFLKKGSFFSVQKIRLDSQSYVVDQITVRTIFNKRKIKKEIKNMMEFDNRKNLTTIIPTNSRNSTIFRNKKKFDTIFFHEKNNLLNHLNHWYNNEEIFKKLGIHYKTGVLLYGPPGTGKTSVARAIAAHLDYDLYIVNIKESTISNLADRFYNIPRKSVILLEEVDCFLKKRNESQMTSDELGILSILLNALDGSCSSEECVFVATTNHIDGLDEAFTRNGRFDLKVYMGDIDMKLAEDMCDNFGLNKNILIGKTFPINPSYLQNELLASTKITRRI